RDGISQGREHIRAQRRAARPLVELLPGTELKAAPSECLQEKPDHLAAAMTMDLHAGNRAGSSQSNHDFVRHLISQSAEPYPSDFSLCRELRLRCGMGAK